MAKAGFTTVDQYIASFPDDVQDVLRAVRKAIRTAVPKVEESISYQIPAFKYHGVIFHIAAWKKHYALYPVSESLLAAFAAELAPHMSEKATLKFTYDEKVPVRLISAMAKLRAKENERSGTAAGRKK